MNDLKIFDNTYMGSKYDPSKSFEIAKGTIHDVTKLGSNQDFNTPSKYVYLLIIDLDNPESKKPLYFEKETIENLLNEAKIKHDFVAEESDLPGIQVKGFKQTNDKQEDCLVGLMLL